MARLLIENDVYVKDDYNKTVLMITSEKGHTEIIKLLEKEEQDKLCCCASEFLFDTAYRISSTI